MRNVAGFLAHLLRLARAPADQCSHPSDQLQLRAVNRSPAEPTRRLPLPRRQRATVHGLEWRIEQDAHATDTATAAAGEEPSCRIL